MFKNRSYKFLNLGFTLIEIIMILSILAILAIVVVPKFIDFKQSALQTKRKEIIRNLKTTETLLTQLYRLQTTSYKSQKEIDYLEYNGSNVTFFNGHITMFYINKNKLTLTPSPTADDTSFPFTHALDYSGLPMKVVPTENLSFSFQCNSLFETVEPTIEMFTNPPKITKHKKTNFNTIFYYQIIPLTNNCIISITQCFAAGKTPELEYHEVSDCKS